MTAEQTTDHFDMNAAPLRVGIVTLKVRDLAKVAKFYETALGLHRLADGGDAVTLGTSDTPLLELAGDPGLAPRDPRQAGLFHTAFLLPDRADLARWLGFAASTRLPLQGASDHIVSEAIYLADPEGNGIEVYVDRPPSRWRNPQGDIQMTTDPLDLQDLLAAAGGTTWAGFPQDGTIGHVHLQVGDTAAADRFYRDILGFDIASRYPGASFFGSGGYHHQIAANVWNSRGAGPRRDGMAGLDGLQLIFADPAAREAALTRARAAGVEVAVAGGEATLRDPWGNRITLSV